MPVKIEICNVSVRPASIRKLKKEMRHFRDTRLQTEDFPDELTFNQMQFYSIRCDYLVGDGHSLNSCRGSGRPIADT